MATAWVRGGSAQLANTTITRSTRVKGNTIASQKKGDTRMNACTPRPQLRLHGIQSLRTPLLLWKQVLAMPILPKLLTRFLASQGRGVSFEVDGFSCFYLGSSSQFDVLEGCTKPFKNRRARQRGFFKGLCSPPEHRLQNKNRYFKTKPSTSKKTPQS